MSHGPVLLESASGALTVLHRKQCPGCFGHGTVERCVNGHSGCECDCDGVEEPCEQCADSEVPGTVLTDDGCEACAAVMESVEKLAARRGWAVEA